MLIEGKPEINTELLWKNPLQNQAQTKKQTNQEKQNKYRKLNFLHQVLF